MQQVKTKLLGSSFYRQKLKDEQINTLSRKLSSVSEVVRMVRSSTSNDTVAVRLVLTEMNKSATHRAIRKLVSPVASQTSLFPQFGMFHTSVIIGSMMFDWNKSSLCNPRKSTSEKAVFVVSLASLKRHEFEPMILALSEYIVKCNTSMNYVNRSGDNQTTLNCQDFVIGLLQQLNITLDLASRGTLVQSTIQQMRSRGRCICRLDKSKYTNSKRIRLLKRKEIDDFIEQACSMDVDFRKTEEFTLLKGFVDAFDLRQAKYLEKRKQIERVIDGCEWEIKVICSGSHLTESEKEEVAELKKKQEIAEEEKRQILEKCARYGPV